MSHPTGIHCPTDLLTCNVPRVVLLSSFFDPEGFQHGERINGYDQCPKCGLWWPCVEEPDCWTESANGEWLATGWWGAAVCCECNLLMVDQPDGRGECYRLGG